MALYDYQRQEERVSTPRKSKVITFSLPPEMAEQVRQVMKEEGRTMSELTVKWCKSTSSC